MAKAWLWPGGFAAQLAQRAQGAIPGKRAESDDGVAAFESLELGDQIREAVVALGGGWPIGRGRAPDHSRDVGVAQAKPVLTSHGFRLVGVAGAVHGGVEPVAGAVAGEHPAGAVGAMCSGSEADDREAGIRVAEARHRARPVTLALEAPRRCRCALPAPLDQPWAATARMHLGCETIE